MPHAAHCCLLDSTRPDQKLPLHLLEPSLIFLSLYYNNIEVYIALWALHQDALSPLNILSEPKSTAHCKPGHNLVSEASSDHSLWTQSPCKPRLGSSRLPWPQSPAPCNTAQHTAGIHSTGCPSFLCTKRMGAPKGDLLGLMKPFSSKSSSCLRSSPSSRGDMR